MRALGLAGAADKVYAAWRAHAAREDNARTRAAHPDIVFPSPTLVHEVQNYARLDLFLQSGAAHAAAIAALIDAHGPRAQRLDILEWGCGPGRILRPLSALLGERARLHGCDPNPACVAAAKAFAPNAAITASAFPPPAPYAEAAFDVVFGVSILTHMEAQAAAAWVADIARLLKPGGLALLTTHGARHVDRLSALDRAAFDAGRHVALGGAPQGSRAFASYTPPAAMQAFIAQAGLAMLAHYEDGPGEVIGQDVWAMRKP